MEVAIARSLPIEEYQQHWIKIIPCAAISSNPRNNSSNIGTIVAWSDTVRGRLGLKDDQLFDHHPHYKRMYLLMLRDKFSTACSVKIAEAFSWQDQHLIYLPLYFKRQPVAVNTTGWPNMSIPVGGWIYVPKEVVRKKRAAGKIGSVFKKEIMRFLNQEVYEFNMWLTGKVWTYQIIGDSINKIGPAFYGEPQDFYSSIVQAAMFDIDVTNQKFFDKQLKLNL